MAKNLYETLGVPKTATDKEIRAAYRKLARKYHPDVAPNDKAAEARFKEMNAAFEVLSDEEKRKKYDKYGDKWEYADQIEENQRRGAGGGFGRAGAGGAYAASDLDDLDFGSIFDSIFRREGRQPAARRGQDVETPAELTLEEAYRGTTRVLRTPQPDGTERRLEVRIPAGVKTGSRIRVAGEGRPGLGGAAAGDAFLVVTVQPHNRFDRRGDDLYVEVPVGVMEAVLGGEAEVPTLDGRIMLRVPELTQNGRQFRLAGKGMPVLGKDGARGDLFARVRVVLPERITEEERTHFEALQQLRRRDPAAAR